MLPDWQPSLTMRVAVAKLVGAAIGLFLFFLAPLVLDAPDPLLRWGLLFWYVTLGAIVGVFGIYDRHPVLKVPMPWYVRAPLVGGWMNLLLVMLAHDRMASLMVAAVGEGSPLASPFWLVLEGALAGLVIGGIATRYGGEGPQTVGARWS